MTMQPRHKNAASKKKIATRRAIRDLEPKKRDIRGGQASIDPGCLPTHKRSGEGRHETEEDEGSHAEVAVEG